jgi:hypothetical protein
MAQQEMRLQERKAAQAREQVDRVTGELKAAIARVAEAEVNHVIILWCVVVCLID